MPVNRRIEVTLTPQKLFDQILHTPMHWPGKTVLLERDSLLDYLQRSVSGRMSIAEFYHENSKLFPHMIPELTASQVNVEAFRLKYLEGRSIVARSSGASVLELDPRWRELLDKTANALELDTFYAIELRILVEGALGVYDPGLDTTHIVKRLSPTEIVSVQEALRVMATPDETPLPGPLLFVLGCFGRNDILFGARGYRRTLQDAGRMTQAVLLQAKRMRIPVRARYDFTERDVDYVMEADGIEQGTLVAIELGETPDAG
jgi:hypothetical protein